VPRSKPGKAARGRRQQLQQAERERARTRGLRIIGGVLASILGLVGVAAVLLFVHRLSPDERALLARATEAAAEAGCTYVRVLPPYPGGLDRVHIGAPDTPSMPSLDRYPSVPPASGPHGGATLPAGTYRSAPSMDTAIHSLEHGAVIVWYDPAAATQPEFAELERFFRTSDEGTHVIVAPYDYPAEGQAGRLPDGSAMALVAWHHVRHCRELSLPVAFSFVEAYRFNLYRWGSYRGDAPERFAPI
jgi:hypothetical protein